MLYVPPSTHTHTHTNTHTHTQSDVCKSISHFMAFVHKSVNEMSMQYLANERRYNYTTPKSFLELVRPCLL